MARVGRRTPLPAQVRARLVLEPGERVLVAAPLQAERWLVATTRALHVSESTGESDRHGWDQVAGAVWSGTASMLEVTWVDGSRQLQAELAGDAGFLPEVIRERVEASVVISRRIEVSGRRGVRVAVRRAAPGAELSTQVVADHGVDLAEPALAARVAAQLSDLREQTGMRD